MVAALAAFDNIALEEREARVIGMSVSIEIAHMYAQVDRSRWEGTKNVVSDDAYWRLGRTLNYTEC